MIMETTHYDYLNFIRFTDLREWDIKRYFSIPIKSDYQIIALSDILIEQKEKFKINDSNKDYGILGVNNQTGIFDAYTENGAKIKQKYKRMECGWIAYNPYRVNVGSIGIKKESNLYEYISPAYVVFSCKSSITPDYLFLTMKTNRFHNQICNATTGSVRQNLSFEILKTLQIPLPTLEQQNNLVELYNTKIHQAESLEKEAAEINSDIENYLIEILGIKQATTQDYEQKGFLRFINFKDTERWDILFFQKRKQQFNSHFDCYSFDYCINKFMTDSNGDSIRIETSKHPDSKFLYIGMENIEKDTGTLTNVSEIFGNEIKSQTTLIPKNFFLYGKLRPYLNKYWYNELDDNNLICSSEFFVFSIKESINPYYFKYYLASNIVQEQISNLSTGARMPRINETVFKGIQIPLPAIEIQNEIVSHINTQKKRIKELRTKATNLRKEAIAEFEKTIFE